MQVQTGKNSHWSPYMQVPRHGAGFPTTKQGIRQVDTTGTEQRNDAWSHLATTRHWQSRGLLHTDWQLDTHHMPGWPMMLEVVLSWARQSA